MRRILLISDGLSEFYTVLNTLVTHSTIPSQLLVCAPTNKTASELIDHPGPITLDYGSQFDVILFELPAGKNQAPVLMDDVMSSIKEGIRVGVVTEDPDLTELYSAAGIATFNMPDTREDFFCLMDFIWQE